MIRLMLLLSLLISAPVGILRADVDFSNYDTPVYEQIVNRIKEKISARLGNGKNTRDRYFILPFAYENRQNDPEFSHTFITVIHVFADNRQPKYVRGLRRGKHQQREFEAFTISWLPADFLTNPNLRVFAGAGARLFPEANEVKPTPGHCFNLEETVKLGANAKNLIVMWGPYEIDKKGFDLGIKRRNLLNEGSIKYCADDRLHRKKLVAINCFHAIAGLDKLYPNGGLFGTGFKMWGVNGTARVLIEYTHNESFKGLLLEPVDVKKDRYSFAYAASRDAWNIYNPGPASAYHK